MKRSSLCSSRWVRVLSVGLALALLAGLNAPTDGADPVAPAGMATSYTTQARPLLKQYCLNCHSTKAKKGELDLERFTSTAQMREDTKPWQAVIEMLENGEMPPKKSLQPKPEERRQLVAWVRGFLDAEARARAGDPGRVVLRRLSNAEYDATLRDLTGVDLQPAREFPRDGAAGEGFTNAGEALVMSPGFLDKYLNAGKEIAAHGVFLPEGIRFSPSKTRRDWTDETLAEIRAFYATFGNDGQLPLAPYLAATLRHRAELTSGAQSVEAVAAKEKLNAKYLQFLWQTLNDPQPSYPLDVIRGHWRQAAPGDVAALAAEIRTWQNQVWKFNKIGSYMNPTWQEANRPSLVATQTLKLQPKPTPGQKDVVLYLVAREMSKGKDKSHVIWRRPRFEGNKQTPFLLRDVAHFGDSFTVDNRAFFADTTRHLGAAAEALRDPKLPVAELAKKHGVDALVLKHWIDYLTAAALVEPATVGKEALVPLRLLSKQLPVNPQWPAVKGWADDTADHLPLVLSNASDKTENVPGTVPPHQLAVHPSPTHFAGIVWNSPLSGTVRVEADVAHAHPPGGNGIAWWFEQRHGEEASVLERGIIDPGKKAHVQAKEWKLAKGDQLVLAVGARDGNHSCDLTTVALSITESAAPRRAWDLAKDVADTIVDANPHADKHGNKDVWRFVQGRDPAIKGKPEPKAVVMPRGSILDQWRAADATRQEQLAEQVQRLLSGDRPDPKQAADQALYDFLTSLDSPLFQGIDLTRWVKTRRPDNEKGAPAKATPRYGLEAARFGRHPSGQPAEEASLVVAAPSVLEVRLPAVLFQERTFIVEAALDPASTDSVVQFQVLTAPPRLDVPLDGATPLVTHPDRADAKRLDKGLDEFRRCFPLYLYHPKLVPDDEIICLRLYCREDDQLQRLFLDAGQTRQLDRLWRNLTFVSQQPLVESKNYPTFMGFVSQDGKSEAARVEGVTRAPLLRRAEEFGKELKAAEPGHLDALLAFAALAYRRPLQATEKAELMKLYETLRKKEIAHEDACRTTLARVLISPSFLYRIEQPGAGKVAQPVSSWEMASRLSYFLWATMPDAELRRAAEAGNLTDTKVLSAQAGRMLRDPKSRGLATEFAAQWLHVRDIRDNREKNEKVFPTFDDKLRQAIFEEGVRFFQDLFQSDRSVLDILDADHTFLDETLAKHYGIPNVTGPQWRRVDGVRKYGRGGILTLGSVLTKQSEAARTSPILRGNWLVDTLLGEKLPKPPPDVPRLPDSETSSEGLTVRQMVEQHTRIPACAVCHQKIDPYGFALERYDAIGRLRDKDLGGKPVDTKVQLKDGTRFEGVDGLRKYLLTQRREEFLRHFCTKLLGYALGRSVTLSDQPLVDAMLAELKKNDYRFSTAVQTIVQSQQFRYHRGLEATKEN